GFNDCTEPRFGDKLSAARFTHLLVRRDTSTGRWLAGRPPIEGLQPTAHFGDGEVFAVTAAAPAVYTARMTAFYPREYDERWTWRWTGPAGSWTAVNR